VARHFASDVAEVASAYLSSHGIFADDKPPSHDLSIMGLDDEPLAPSIRSALPTLERNQALSCRRGGCSVAFGVNFDTWGTNVIGILPMDSQWTYHSNGLMEREYLDGISEALTAAKVATPRLN
jgi:hypothetical protein